MRETEQYILTQDTKSVFEAINNNQPLPVEFEDSIEKYLQDISATIQRAINSNISVISYREEEITTALEEQVMQQLERDDVVCVCLDRYLLVSIENFNPTRFVRFSITRRKDGTKAPRPGNSSFIEQIQQIKNTIPDIYSKKVLLIDDGIFSGGTLRDFLELWESTDDRPLPVERIVTFIGNEKQLPTLPQQWVASPVKNLYDWIDIRDLGPWAGKLLATSRNNRAGSSIPYLFPWSDGQEASLNLSPSLFATSKQCIKEAQLLVSSFESYTGKQLTFRNLVRAGFPLPTDERKTIPISINDIVTDYLSRTLERIADEEERMVMIFDMDGTLYQLDGEKNGFNDSTLEQRVLENARLFILTNITNGNAEDADSIMAQGLADTVGLSMYIQENYGIPRQQYFDTVWDINPEGIVQNFEDARQALLAFSDSKPNGKKILLTSAPRIWAKRVLSFLGLTEQFEEIFTGDQYKNKSEIFQMLAARYNPNNITSVGDQEKTDIEPAQQVGIKGILILKPSDIWNIV